MKNKTLQENAEKLDIEESREKRLGRIKAKRRDRGGIFQPREDNPLLDILMSRDISGRSPTKPRSRSQRPSVERDNRGSCPKAKSSMKRNGVPRRASAASNVSSNVAGKQRRKSQAPPSNTGYSDDEAATRGKVKCEFFNGSAMLDFSRSHARCSSEHFKKFFTAVRNKQREVTRQVF